MDRPAHCGPSYHGNPISYWIQALQGTDPLERLGAAVAVGSIFMPGFSGMPPAPQDVRDYASRALEDIGAATVADLFEALPGLILPELAYFLQTIGPVAAEAVAILRARHGGADSGETSSAAVPAVPALVGLLAYRVSEQDHPGAWALGGMGSVMVPDLVHALGYEDSRIREGAALALGYIGTGAAVAVPALGLALKDEQLAVQKAAMEAIGRIGPAAAAAVPALIEVVQMRAEAISYKAIVVLGKIGPGAAMAVPALVEAMGDEDYFIRTHAGMAVKLIDPDAAVRTKGRPAGGGSSASRPG